jgi:F0F1-type ATP synthase delta subunit
MKRDKIKLYAKALADILDKPASVKTTAWQGKIINNFVKLLVNTGYENKSKEVLNLAEDFLLAKQGKRKITFETARKTKVSQRKLLETIVKKGDVLKEKINPELIAGVKIIINDSQQFDASFAGKLQSLFE